MYSKLTSVVALLFLAIILISCSGSPDYLPVPADAEAIVRIDPTRISKKLVVDNATELDFWDLFKESKPGDTTKKRKTPLEELLDDPGKAGIDYLENVYAFRKKDKNFLVFEVDDKSDLTNFLKDQLKLKVTKIGDHDYCVASNFTIAYSKNVGLLYLGDSLVNAEPISQLINLKKEKTIFNNEFPVKFKDVESDLLILTNPSRLLSSMIGEQSGWPVFNDSYILGTVNFEDGKMNFELNDVFHKDFEGYLKNINLQDLGQIYTTNSVTIGGFNFSPTLFERAAHDTVDTKISQIGLDKKTIINSLGGGFYWNIRGFKENLKIFKTFETDEEFNTVEKTDTSRIIYPDFTGLISLNDTSSAAMVLKTLQQKHILEAVPGGYSFNFLAIPIYFSIKNKNLIVSDVHNPVLTTSGNDINKYKNSFFFSEVNTTNFHKDYKKDFEDLKSAMVAFQQGGNGKYKLVIEIITNEPDKNSFRTLRYIVKEQTKKQKTENPVM